MRNQLGNPHVNLFHVNLLSSLPSDHSALFSTINLTRPPNSKKEVSFRKFRSMDSLRNDIKLIFKLKLSQLDLKRHGSPKTCRRQRDEGAGRNAVGSRRDFVKIDGNCIVENAILTTKASTTLGQRISRILLQMPTPNNCSTW